MVFTFSCSHTADSPARPLPRDMLDLGVTSSNRDIPCLCKSCQRSHNVDLARMLRESMTGRLQELDSVILCLRNHLRMTLDERDRRRLARRICDLELEKTEAQETYQRQVQGIWEKYRERWAPA